MKKKILVVIGSPRYEGNTTLMAEAFIEGAKESGHIVNVFDVNEFDIKGCVACNCCWANGKPCAHSEDFNTFAEMVTLSDVIVFASPVYWGTYPAPLKAFIDKMYCFAVPWCKKHISFKETVLLSCGDGPDASAFDVINLVYKGLCDFLKWNVVDMIEVPGLVEAGAIKNTDALEKARKKGRKI